MPNTSELAINGGASTVTEPPQVQPRWGEPELEQLKEMLEQASLFYWNGPQTQLLVERFRGHYPLQHVMPCSSGTAALHIAVAAAGVGPGDEVITTAITDMGTVIGVLYQNAVPVFADLKPHTYNLDPADVERKITPRTKAIIAVHLTGNPCALNELKALCEKHDLVLIEDCAQAWGAQYRSTPVGTIGDIGCWSLNDFKHIGCGDGGIVATNSEKFGPLLQKFGDKSYDRVGGTLPDTLAPNYRISEPQSAIAAAQMERMWDITEKRGRVGRILSEQLAATPGVQPHQADAEDRWTCWFYMFRLDLAALHCDRARFVEALKAEGVSCGAGYLAAPLYQFPLFANHSFFAGRWPIKEMGLTEMDYTQVCCPETEAILATAVTVPARESWSEEYSGQVAEAIKKVARHFAK